MAMIVSLARTIRALWVWGQSTDSLTPQHLLAPDGFVFTSIDGGDYHAVAILAAIPEPSTAVLTILARGLGWALRKRFMPPS
jgi:hypothetical protein